MVHEVPASKKRMVVFIVLGLGGFVSLLLGLWWDAVLQGFATDIARTENFFNLIDPDHISLAHAVVAGIVGFGHFLFVCGVGALLTGPIGAVYNSGLPGRMSPGSRRALVAGTGALVLLAVGGVAWATSATSYEARLAAAPGGPSDRSAGQREEHHAGCETSPTPEQREAADELAAETKASVTKYEDPLEAEAEGYRPTSPDWRPVTHYLNPGHQRDGEILNTSRPEALVYANTSEGAVLLGAMYLMPEPGVSGPSVGGCLTRWHAHSLRGWETPEMMHVWTADVPGEPFSELRPRLWSLRGGSRESKERDSRFANNPDSRNAGPPPRTTAFRYFHISAPCP